MGSSAFLSRSELKAGGAAGHHVNFLSRLDHLIPLGERLAGGTDGSHARPILRHQHRPTCRANWPL